MAEKTIAYCFFNFYLLAISTDDVGKLVFIVNLSWEYAAAYRGQSKMST
jgi:hypothetical protein